MKKIIFILLMIPISLIGFTQNDSIIAVKDSIVFEKSEAQILAHLDSIIEGIDNLVYNAVRLHINKSRNNYKMYPTENIYNLLKLDTQTGKIEQVQWSLDEDKEFSTIINSEDLSLYNSVNSFELYPTKNIYQFILLDKYSGRTWHVQWGLSSNKRWIKRIY